MKFIVLVFAVNTLLATKCSGQINRPPEFLRGGDMDMFSIKEDTSVGSHVYTLRARDPENTQVRYYISGDSFSVEKDTGIVKLIRALDREAENTIDVIISITDERVHGLQPNTISIKREITVLDQNDNPPKFNNIPYSFTVSEATPVGTTVYRGILVTDADIGINAEIKLSCVTEQTPEACQKFDVQGRTISNGRLQGEIVLLEPLDYEIKTTYNMTISAEDSSENSRLHSETTLVVSVQDTQDHLPVFHNAPFTATVLENSNKGTSVLNIIASDGDSGDPREIKLVIENDERHFFQLGSTSSDKNKILTATLETANPIDREDDEILDNGGLYIFQIKAIELENGIETGDSFVANVTIVIGDVNDQVPQFNQHEFNVTISEDIGINTPLPGLNIVAYDMDVGDNAKFSLALEDVLNSKGVFSVFPSVAVGRSPVVIRITNSSKLDYEVPDRRVFIFKILAVQENFKGSSTKVTVMLADANDNAPQFESDQYIFQVPENATHGTSIFTLPAYDADSGSFGEVTYSLKGFGSDKFNVERKTGEIKVSDCGHLPCLDYELQKSYSLSYEAQDGGGKVTTVNIFMEILDVNDNAPQFTKDVYTQEVLENTEKLLPPLVIKAIDSDGPSQGGGEVTYSVLSSELQDISAVAIDSVSGEVSLRRPLKHSETPNRNGLVTIVIRATDKGNPPLSATSKLILKVKRENDGAPEFVNLPYLASVKENSIGGSSVIKVVASDPDGPDAGITYYIQSGGKDNFVIDQKRGVISVASGADLDRDIYGTEYKIQVQAVDSGTPVQQTATATVTIMVEDVNNKPPKFVEDSYVKYISESTSIGEEVLQVAATDPDKDAKLRYSIVEPIIARDKTGSLASFLSSYDYKTAFKIDGTTGKITVNHSLDYNSASVVILTVEAVDLNAIDVTFGKQQKASVEVTMYIRVQEEMNPMFSPPWTQSKPVIEISLPEETLIGSTLLTISARDPLTHTPVTNFEKQPGSDPDNYVSVSPVSGVVALNRRLDFEELPKKQISFKVKAVIGELKNQRSSEATVVINVQDINDNSPVFSQNTYITSVSESAEYPQSILTVLASDKDSQAFGTIEYSISGDGSNVFDIDPVSGTISIQENATLDREMKAVYNLQVTATDNPTGVSNQRRTSIIVVIKILDENDNAPKFNQEIYTAVIPENVPIDFSVVTVKATDTDSGRNGEVQYIMQETEDQPMSFFAIDSETGVVSVIRALSGKGRSEPYTVKIQAMDKGNPPLQSESHLLVVIGDISTNDGVPQFVRPTAGEITYIQENVTVGTEVFQVIAFDPDNSNTVNGKVAYKLLNDQSTEDQDYEFVIDAATGIITTRAPLDRERKENYTMIVVAHDFGFPPQEAHRVLRIFVLDVDDSDPQFIRPLKSQPVEIMLKEEVPMGTVAGVVRALDNDTGVNSVIDYYILNGNTEEVFEIRRTQENAGELIVQKRIDRENVSQFTLTIKVSKPSQPVTEFGKPYNYEDLSETQVTILIEDIDDNPPIFETSSYVLGARANTEVDSELVTLRATDPDASSSPITYSIRNMTFIRPSTQENTETLDAFHISPKSGLLSNNEILGKYVGGHFDITVEARSSPGTHNLAFANVKVYILQDRDLLKFVFYKRPNEVRNIIPQFEKDLKLTLAQPISLNMYDTNFYARSDGSLDFESTSSCFQMLENDVIVEPKKVMKILNQGKSPMIKDLYNNYSVVAIESCVPAREAYKIRWHEMFVLVIAGLIALTSLLLCILICVFYSSYMKKLKRTSYFHTVYMTENGGHPPILSPAEQQRIYEWQEMNAPSADAASFRSYPTLR